MELYLKQNKKISRGTAKMTKNKLCFSAIKCCGNKETRGFVIFHYVDKHFLTRFNVALGFVGAPFNLYLVYTLYVCT